MRRPKKQLLGFIGIETGQMLVTDPGHLNHWIHDEPFGHPILLDNKTGKHFTFGGFPIGNPQKKQLIKQLDVQNFLSYGTMLRDGRTVNQLIEKEELVKLEEPEPRNPYGYNAACYATGLPEQGGEVGYGVAVRTGWGDGSYPVWAKYTRDGWVKKVIIEFIE
jgi:hypothetical protein